MSGQLTPATAEDVAAVAAAINSLRGAVALLSTAKAHRAAAATRMALKSAEGALRHAQRRQRASEDEAAQAAALAAASEPLPTA